VHFSSIFVACILACIHVLSLPALHSQTAQNVGQTATNVPQASHVTPPDLAHSAARQTSKSEAWQILEIACAEDKVLERADATRALGLLPKDIKARKLAEKALSDSKAEVRTAAASALGDLRSRMSIPKLRDALNDDDPSVALAAAHALYLMRDRSSYQVYYEVLTKQRKGGKGLIASQMSIFNDHKKLAQLGFQEGIGFVPFGGIGWTAVKELTKDDTSPVRAASARVLADDPDPATTKVLADEAGDKSWMVRAAALEALAKRGDPSAIDTVKLYIYDEKDIVRFTAAAATIHLLAIREARTNKSRMDARQSSLHR